jgi:hypothetical protein
MTAPDESPAIKSRLSALLDSGAMSAAAAGAARELLDRLDAPARVVIFGLPGAGKSALMNILAGEVVIPAGFTVPTLLLRHGAAAKTEATLGDGSSRVWPGLAIKELREAEAAFIQLDLPLASLERMSLLEIVADETPDDQLAAMGWAAGRTDIAIWCSGAFDESEADLWRRAPELLQDNAILVLTQSRTPAANGDFRRSFAVDTAAARESLLPEGAAALIDEVKRLAALGRQAYVDHALLFLSRYESRRAGKTVGATQATPAAKPATPAKSPLVLAPAPARPPSRPRPGSSRPLPMRADVPRQALDYLRLRAHDLSDALPKFGPAPGTGVLGHCLETMEQLIERVSAPEEMDVDSADVEELVLETADVIMLLQSETGEAPAADAVTLLLQLRRELEARLAA